MIAATLTPSSSTAFLLMIFELLQMHSAAPPAVAALSSGLRCGYVVKIGYVWHQVDRAHRALTVADGYGCERGRVRQVEFTAAATMTTMMVPGTAMKTGVPGPGGPMGASRIPEGKYTETIYSLIRDQKCVPAVRVALWLLLTGCRPQIRRSNQDSGAGTAEFPSQPRRPFAAGVLLLLLARLPGRSGRAWQGAVACACTSLTLSHALHALASVPDV